MNLNYLFVLLFGFTLACVNGLVTQYWGTYITGGAGQHDQNDLTARYLPKGDYSQNSRIGGRYGFGMSKFSNEEFAVYGGNGYTNLTTGTTLLGDLWFFSLPLKQWKWVSGVHYGYYDGSWGPKTNFLPSNLPAAKRFFTMVHLPTQNYLMIFGGDGVDESGNQGDLNDLWFFDLISSEWAYMKGSNTRYDNGHRGTKGIEASNVVPEARMGYGMVKLPQKEIVVIFGGEVYDIDSELTNDMFTYNILTNDFTWIFGGENGYNEMAYLEGPTSYLYHLNNTISARSFMSMYSISSNIIAIFGGEGYPEIGEPFSFGVLSDLWTYNLTSKMWAHQNGKRRKNVWGGEGYMTQYDAFPKGTYGDFYPKDRYGHVGMYIESEKNLYVFGGQSSGSYELDDALIYNFNEKKWKWIYGGDQYIGSDESLYYGVYSNNIYNVDNKIGHFRYAGIEHFTEVSSKGLERTYFIIFGGSRAHEYSNFGSLNDMWKFREIYECSNIYEYDSSVCGSHGNCNIDNECICDNNYNGINCTYTICNGLWSNDNNVCSAHGKCINHNCICNDENEWRGNDCEYSVCNGLSSIDPNVCGSSGVCTNQLLCNCNIGYSGTNCEFENAFMIVLVNYWYVWFVVIPSLIVIVVIGLFISVMIICIILLKQRKKIKKFDQIEDVDLILQEQKAMREYSGPRITIKQELFVVDSRDIKLKEIIGRGGSSSTVFQVEYKGKIAAYKCFRNTALVQTEDESYKEFEHEVGLLASLKHPNILYFLGASIYPKCGILMEYCKKGDLQCFILKNKPVDLKEKIRLLSEIAIAMEYVHSVGVIHRDLKPQNVLISDINCTKLMDFGISKICQSFDQTKTRRVGTSYFMSPEVVLSSKYDEKCDVFSFGIIISVCIQEIFTHPYGKNSSNGVEMKVAKNPEYRPKVRDDSFTKCIWLKELMINCYDHETKIRFSFQEIVKKMKSGMEDMEKHIKNNKNKQEEDVEDIKRKMKLLEEQVAKQKKEIKDKDILLSKK